LPKPKLYVKISSVGRRYLFSASESSSSTAPNKACTRRVGVCAIYKHFSGFKLFLHLKHCPRPSTRG